MKVNMFAQKGMKKAQSTSKKLIFLLITILFVGLGVWFVSSITFNPIAPIFSPSSTNNSNITISNGINFPDGIVNLTSSWDGFNSTFIDNFLVGMCNMNNLSALGENDTFSICWNTTGQFNGTVVGGTNISYTPNGKYNGGFNWVNGSKAYISTNLNISLLSKNNMTFYGWVNSNSTSTQTILGTAGGFIIRYANNQIVFYPKASFACTFYLDPSTKGNWFDFMLIFDQTSNKTIFYANGKYNTTCTNADDLSGNDLLDIGRWGTQYFNGLIDSIMVFNRNLSADEYYALHNTSIQKMNNSFIEYNTTKYNLVSSVSGNNNYTSFICSANSTNNIFCSIPQIITKIPNNQFLTANFSNNLSVIKDYTYGVNAHGNWMSNLSWIDKNNDGSLEYPSDYEWNRQMFLASGMNFYRADIDFWTESSGEGTFYTSWATNGSHNINIRKNLVQWASENNIRILFITLEVPNWLADQTTGMCNISNQPNANWSCPPSNYTKYGQMVVDYLHAVGCDIHQSTCYIEVANEPANTGFYLNNITSGDPRRTIELNKKYNATWIAVKAVYPNIKIGGVGTFDISEYPVLSMNIMGNFSNQMDFFSTHVYRYDVGYYWDTEPFDDLIKNKLDLIYKNLSFYNVNYSEVIISEIGIRNSSVTNASDGIMLSLNYALAYMGILNYGSNNLSVLPYQWSDTHSYYNNPTYYGEYPYKWSFVSETNLDNEILAPYNITTIFTHLFSEGDTTFSSSSDSYCLRIISANKGGKYAIAIANNCSFSVNATLNLTLTNGTIYYPYNNLTNYTGKNLINVNLGIAQIGVIGGNQVVFLSSGIFPIISQVQPTNLTLNITSHQINFSANLSDDVGLTNSTLNVLNISDNSLQTLFTNYIHNEQSIIQTWLIPLTDGIYKWWIELWDDEGKNTTTGNYTLSIDTVLPTITFQLPTPTNNSIVNYSNQTIVANISQNTGLNTSSFIDFDRSLVGYWAMDYYNATGIFDNSSYSNFGTFKNGSNYSNLTTGIRGSSLTFDGSNDYISTNFNVTNVNADYTISVWFKSINSAGGVEQFLVSKGYGYRIYLSGATNQVQFDNINITGKDMWMTSGVSTNDGNWHQAVLTYNSSNNMSYGYIDGVYKCSVAVTGGLEINNNKILIGGTTFGAWWLNGSIDETLLFNRVLSLTEVKALYDSQSNKFNATFTNLSEGQHNYTVYAIDQAGNLNSSNQNFSLDINNPYFTTIPANASLFYTNPLLVTFIGIDAGGFGYYSINDTRFSINQTGFLSNASPMAIGNYEINVSINDSVNNINWTRYTVQINKSQTQCKVLFNETSPLEYPKTFLVWANCTSDFVLMRNGIVILNNSQQILGIGTYNFSMSRNDSVNYTYYYNDSQFIVQDTIKPTLSFESQTTNSTNLSQSNIYVNITSSDASNYSILSNIGLRFWVRFNNETGENNSYAKDYSINGNNLTGYNGTTSNSSGKLGYCMKFDGVDDIMKTPDISLNITNAITISSWVYINNYTQYRRIIAKSPYMTNTYPYTTYGLLTDINSSGFTRVRLELASGGIQHIVKSTTNVTNGQWYLITGTFDSSTGQAKLYIDGVLDNSTLLRSYSNGTLIPVTKLLNTTIDKSPFPVTLGDAIYQFTTAINACIDDSFIYDRELSSNEILAYYNGTRLDHNITNLQDGNYNLTAYAQDSSGNINSTSRWVTLDTTSPSFSDLSPGNGAEDLDGIVDFFYSVADAGDVLWCSIFINNVSIKNDSAITKGLIETFQLKTSLLEIPVEDNVRWFISCMDNTGNIGNSTNRGLDTNPGESHPEGGSGGGGGTPTPTNVTYTFDSTLCNLTYESANLLYPSDLRAMQIQNDYAYSSGRVPSYEEIHYFIFNWQKVCSDDMKKSLHEAGLCSDIYSILSVGEFNITSTKIVQDKFIDKNAAQSLNISNQLISHYVRNYNKMCVAYSPAIKKRNVLFGGSESNNWILGVILFGIFVLVIILLVVRRVNKK